MSEEIREVPDKVKAIEMQSGQDISLDVRAVVKTMAGPRVLLTPPGKETEIVIAKYEAIAHGDIVRSYRNPSTVVHYKLVGALKNS